MPVLFDDSNSYRQPFVPIPVSGQRHALPPNFVDGLSFLHRFVVKSPVVVKNGIVVRNWNRVEGRIHLLDGILYLLTNKLIVEYKISENDLPDLSFDPRTIRLIEAFDAPPAKFSMGTEPGFLFAWDDGQELCIKDVFDGPICPADNTCKNASHAFDRHWREFNRGVVPTPDERREVKKFFDAKLSKDIYLKSDTVVGRMRRDGKNWTSEYQIPFSTETARLMRVDRPAFVAMVKIATEISFRSSPICFRHQHGRGMLIERTLGSGVPALEWDDD